MTDETRENPRESHSVRDSGEFEITEFDVAGFNCMLVCVGSCATMIRNVMLRCFLIFFISYLFMKAILPFYATSKTHSFSNDMKIFVYKSNWFCA